MKKIVLGIMFICMASVAFAGPGIKVSPVYGLLLCPDLTVIEDTTGSEVTKGGVGASFQYLMGISKIAVGAEISYLPVVDYEYDFSGTQIIGLSVKAIPILGVASVEIPLPGKFNPYIQGGAGVAAILSEVKGNNVAIDVGSSAGCVMIGGGVLIKLLPLLSLDISVKYYNIGLELEEADDKDSTSILSIGGGLYLKI
jgi:hypothetical protein